MPSLLSTPESDYNIIVINENNLLSIKTTMHKQVLQNSM